MDGPHTLVKQEDVPLPNVVSSIVLPVCETAAMRTRSISLRYTEMYIIRLSTISHFVPSGDSSNNSAFILEITLGVAKFEQACTQNNLISKSA